MPARLHAAIDVGTNTVRMLVGSVDRGKVRPAFRLRRITSMGKALRGTGAIGTEEFRRSVAVLQEFRREMDRLGVVAYRACGTAALREASNSGAFVAASAEAGIRLEVIGAAEEARRTWDGIHAGLRERDDSLVMDIGGGSTEFIAGPGKVDSVSLPIGVVVLLGLFTVSDPPRPWELSSLRHYLSERIAAGTGRWRMRRFRRLIGTAGTFTTLAALDMKMTSYRPEKVDGYKMPLATVRRWEERLSRLTEAQRLGLPGMEKGRERYIVPGAAQARAAMERFGARELVISDAGLLEGILLGMPIGKGEGK